jgi:hypothetical protein
MNQAIQFLADYEVAALFASILIEQAVIAPAIRQLPSPLSRHPPSLRRLMAGRL